MISAFGPSETTSMVWAEVARPENTLDRDRGANDCLCGLG